MLQQQTGEVMRLMEREEEDEAVSMSIDELGDIAHLHGGKAGETKRGKESEETQLQFAWIPLTLLEQVKCSFSGDFCVFVPLLQADSQNIFLQIVMHLAWLPNFITQTSWLSPLLCHLVPILDEA